MPRLGPHHSIDGDWQIGTFQRRETVHHTSLSRILSKNSRKKRKKKERKRMPVQKARSTLHPPTKPQPLAGYSSSTASRK
jgi:hypothetical protein